MFLILVSNNGSPISVDCDNETRMKNPHLSLHLLDTRM